MTMFATHREWPCGIHRAGSSQLNWPKSPKRTKAMQWSLSCWSKMSVRSLVLAGLRVLSAVDDLHRRMLAADSGSAEDVHVVIMESSVMRYSKGRPDPRYASGAGTRRWKRCHGSSDLVMRRRRFGAEASRSGWYVRSAYGPLFLRAGEIGTQGMTVTVPHQRLLAL